jgi:hypothetical protein
MGNRLAPAEKASFNLGVRTVATTGSWDSNGRFRLPGAGALMLQPELSGMVRLLDVFQVGASLPLVTNVRGIPRALDTGYGLGDARVFGRYHVTLPGAVGALPGVALTLAALLPTGTGPLASRSPVAADATGQGLTELRPGFALEKTWLNGWQFNAGGSLGWRVPQKDAQGKPLEMLPRLSLYAAAGPTLANKLSILLGMSHEREAALLLDGKAVKNGERSHTYLLSVVAYEISDNWNVVGAVQGSVPVSHLGQNEETTVSATVGVRRVVGAWDL